MILLLLKWLIENDLSEIFLEPSSFFYFLESKLEIKTENYFCVRRKYRWNVANILNC